jgi:hypothetical protein
MDAAAWARTGDVRGVQKRGVGKKVPEVMMAVSLALEVALLEAAAAMLVLETNAEFLGTAIWRG